LAPFVHRLSNASVLSTLAPSACAPSCVTVRVLPSAEITERDLVVILPSFWR
jgi:hypothetical protein